MVKVINFGPEKGEAGSCDALEHELSSLEETVGDLDESLTTSAATPTLATYFCG